MASNLALDDFYQVLYRTKVGILPIYIQNNFHTFILAEMKRVFVYRVLPSFTEFLGLWLQIWPWMISTKYFIEPRLEYYLFIFKIISILLS